MVMDMMFSFDEYRQEEFLFEDHQAVVVFPNQPDEKHSVVQKMEYWGAFPETERMMLAHGYHLIFVANDNRWGTEIDLDRKARFLKYVSEKYGLENKCVSYGQSCGGLFSIKFAARFPELTYAIYADAPVLNYMSCPCGFGIGECLAKEKGDYSEILKALGLTMSELICYRDMPMDHLQDLIDHQIPVVLVAGDSDHVVPYIENGILLENAYKKAGLPLEVYIKPGCDHHPHGLEDPTPVVAFLDRYAQKRERKLSSTKAMN